MSFQVLQPSPLLAPYVKMYWTMESSMQKNKQHIQRIIPNGLTELIFYHNDVPESTLNKGVEKSQSQISGQKNAYFDLTVRGTTKLFSVLFKPQGLSRFFKIPASELFNQTVPLRILLGNRLNEIEDKLFEAKSTEEKVNIVEDLLFSLLKKHENYALPRITESVRQINSFNEKNSVPALASEACLSRKQFERTFTEIIGITPGQFMRVVRFQKAIFLQQNKQNIKLTELAFEAGYYDQSHMISEFKQLSGFTPKQYFLQCPAFSDYFSFI